LVPPPFFLWVRSVFLYGCFPFFTKTVLVPAFPNTHLQFLNSPPLLFGFSVIRLFTPASASFCGSFFSCWGPPCGGGGGRLIFLCFFFPPFTFVGNPLVVKATLPRLFGLTHPPLPKSRQAFLIPWGPLRILDKGWGVGFPYFSTHPSRSA